MLYIYFLSSCSAFLPQVKVISKMACLTKSWATILRGLNFWQKIKATNIELRAMSQAKDTEISSNLMFVCVCVCVVEVTRLSIWG